MGEEKTKLIIDDLSAIKYEEGTKFDSSVSVDAYRKAITITSKIQKENQNFRELKKKGTAGNKLRNSEQIYNILFFTGAKGSGKTSVMLSYMEYLKDYYRKKNILEPEWRLESEEPLMFTGLEYIDASVMDKKEDILGCVLSKMLKKWKEEELRSYESQRMGIIQTNDYAYRKRSISLVFDRVYTNLKNLRSSRDVIEDEDDTFLETLEKLSLSWNLKESFQELVQKYLGIMKYPNTDELKIENHFLVISIDEADMNIEHGFEIIEQIRQYLMGPNIIVLLSADYEQLEKICENHFAREFSAINKSENMEKHIKKLTREYLEKIIPSDRRIFMPSGNKWKLLDRQEIAVYYKDNKEDLYGEGTIKQIVQKKCKDNLGIELYTDGELIKYFTPCTLRELSAWIKKMKEFSNLDVENANKNFKAYEWFEGEMFPEILKKEDVDDTLFLILNGLNPREQIKLIKNELGYKNNEQDILEILSLLQIENLEIRKKANIYLLFISMKIVEIMQGYKNQEVLDYYSKWGIWGTWEQDMGFEYVISHPTMEMSTMTCKIHCFRFVKFNTALEISLEGIFKTLSEGKNLTRSQLDKIKNFQYMMLFLEMDEEFKGNENPWEFIFENKKVRLKSIYDADGKQGGVFSLSNSILNVFKKCELVRSFCKCIEMELHKFNIEPKKLKTIMREVSIFKDKNQAGIELMPFFNMEFLINLGKKLEQEFSRKAIVEFSSKNVSSYLSRYCRIIKQELKKYDEIFNTTYEEDFSRFGLFRKILQKDTEFLETFYETVQKIYVPEGIGLSD